MQNNNENQVAALELKREKLCTAFGFGTLAALALWGGTLYLSCIDIKYLALVSIVIGFIVGSRLYYRNFVKRLVILRGYYVEDGVRYNVDSSGKTISEIRYEKR